MNKNKIMSILKSLVLILIIVAFVSFLRFQAADLSAVPADQQSFLRDSSGLPYFTELDSYYNLRMTQDFLNYGHMGDSIVNGTPWDTLSYAPVGRSAEYRPMIVYVTAFLYRIANMFSEISLPAVAFYASGLIAPLAAIPAFIIVRRITNNYGGATAALIVSLAPNYFSHTFVGFFDTDMFNVVLPLFMILFLIESLKSSKLIYRIIFVLLAVLSMVLLSLAWDGYIFYLGMLVLFVLFYLLFGFILKLDFIKPIKKYPNILSWLVNQREIFSIVLIVIIGFIGLVLANGFEAVIGAPMELIAATQIQTTGSASYFPNVFISVAELQIPNLLYGGIPGAFSANPGGVINGIGGIIPTFGALSILILLAIRLWNSRSIRNFNDKDKKPPKGQRKSTSKLKDSSLNESLIDSSVEDLKSIADVNKFKRETLLYLTLFSVWIISSAIAVTQGSRFIAVLMIPFGLCVGLFVGYAVVFVKNKLDDKNKLMVLAIGGLAVAMFPIYQTFKAFYKLYGISYTEAQIIPLVIFLVLIGISALLIYGFKKIKSSKFGKTAVMLIITFAILTPTIIGAYQISETVIPSTSDPMWDSMLWVKANTTNTTTIASWWDFGYLFEIASERPTIFDGGSQTGIRAYWIGHALKTNNTDLSAAIFKMLAYSGDAATETLDNYTGGGGGKSVEILQNTLTLSAEDAKDKMVNTYHLTPTQADEIVKMTHPTNPKPVIFVASSDMIQKAYWWSFFGNWDFDAQNSRGYQYMISQVPAEMKKINDTTSQAIVSNYDGGQFGYYTVITKGVDNNTTNATFKALYPNGTQVKYPNGTDFIPTINKNETITINKLIVIEEGIMWKNETVNESANFTLLVWGTNGSYTSILMNKELENAMFTKLFILQGFDQNAFELVHTEPGISLWKVNGIPTLKNETK